MPRSIKANLPWVDAVGSKIAESLSERYARPMIYRQSGPYTQSKTPHVGIYFNDPILHHIAPTKPGQSVDFRFGFYLERDFMGSMFVGFDMLNPTLGRRFLMPNMRADLTMVAGNLNEWLRLEQSRSSHLRIGINDGTITLKYDDKNTNPLIDAIKSYTCLPKNRDLLRWKRLHFSATARIPKFVRWMRADLVTVSSEVADLALISFQKLDFLYSMLFPRDLGPSRLSGGQNRALKASQPDRLCSWTSTEHCEGIVHAAHIKPDRLGGHAIAGNLFWLCQFHHTLVDTYLRASLSVDPSSKRVIASVRTKPPTPGKAGGIPLAIWELIEDKQAWPLPLREDAIKHLFA